MGGRHIFLPAGGRHFFTESGTPGQLSKRAEYTAARARYTRVLLPFLETEPRWLPLLFVPFSRNLFARQVQFQYIFRHIYYLSSY